VVVILHRRSELLHWFAVELRKHGTNLRYTTITAAAHMCMAARWKRGNPIFTYHSRPADQAPHDKSVLILLNMANEKGSKMTMPASAVGKKRSHTTVLESSSYKLTAKACTAWARSIGQ
jgi:hypothetical protein